MEEIIPLVSSAQDAWKELNLEEKKRAWESTVKPKLDTFKEESGLGKRKLGEQTKKLRAMTDEDKLKGMGALIRAYQEEIDKSNQRYEFTEALHNSIWNVLQRVQDPAVLLNTTMKAIREEEAEKQKAAAETFKVRKELGLKTKQLEEVTEKLAQGGAQNTQGNDPRLAAAQKRIEEMEADRAASIEQFKKAATALARVGELERINATQTEQLKALENERDTFANERNKLKEIEAERDKLAKALAEYESKSTAVQQDDAKVAELERRLEEATEDNKELQEAFDQERERANAAVQANKEKDEQLRQLSLMVRRVEELEAASEKSKDLEKQLEAEKAESSKRVRDLQSRLAEQDELVDRLNTSIEEDAKANEGQVGKHTEELEEVRALLEEVTRAKAELETRLKEETQNKKDIIQRLEKERDEATHSQSAQGERELEKLKAVELALEDATTRLSEKENAVASLEQQLEEEKKASAAAHEEKDKEITNLNARIIELEIEAGGSDASDEVAQLKEELESSRGEAQRAKEEAETLKKEVSGKEEQLRKAAADHAEVLERSKAAEKEALDAELRIDELQAEIDSLKEESESNTKGAGEHAKELEEAENRHRDELAALQVQLEQSVERIKTMEAEANAKEETLTQQQLDLSSKGEELSAALKNSQQLDKLVAENSRKISDLEKKHQDAISENLLNQELIQQQLHTIAQLKGEEEENNIKGATPRASGNFQDSLVEELTQLVGSLRENNEKLTLEAQAHEEECSALKEKVRERDEKINSLVANLNGNDSVEGLRSANQQLAMDVHNKSLIIERLMDEDAKAGRAASLAERDERIRQLEENELSARQSIATAESHMVELTNQLESLNDNVRQLEVQLDTAKEEGREKDEKMGAALVQKDAAIKKKDDVIKQLEAKLEDRDGKNSEKLGELEKVIETLKAQNSSLANKSQSTDKSIESLHTTISAQVAKIQELEQQLHSRDDDALTRSKSNDTALSDAKRKIESLTIALEGKDSELADMKAKHQEGIKQLVAQNAELLVQSERHESTQSELERNLADLANSYRQVSDKSEVDMQQFQDALASSKQASKNLQLEIDSIRQEYEGRILKLKNDYETRLATSQSEPVAMHDISLNEKYDELLKESQLMHRNLQQLESELENAKEALRKKDEERALIQPEMDGGDPWSRLGLGGNAVCYAPVVALSYWRRWWGRPAGVHTS